MDLNKKVANTAAAVAMNNAAYAAIEAAKYFKAFGAAIEDLAAIAESGNNHPDLEPDLPNDGTTAATVNLAVRTMLSGNNNSEKDPCPELITVEIHPYMDTDNHNVREPELYNAMDNSLHLKHIVAKPMVLLPNHGSTIGNTDDRIVMLQPNDGRVLRKKRKIHALIESDTTDASAAGTSDLIPQKKQKMAKGKTVTSFKDETTAEAPVSADPNSGKTQKGTLLKKDTRSTRTRWSYEERQYLAFILCNLKHYRQHYREELLRLIGSTGKWNVCSRAFADKNYNSRSTHQCKRQAHHMAQQTFEKLTDVQGKYRLPKEHARRIIKKDHH